MIVLLNSLYNELKELNADEIKERLSENSEAEYEKANNISYKICDVASLFVASAFLSEKNIENKKKFRKEAYLSFLSRKRDVYQKAWEMIDLLLGKTQKCNTEIMIKILKGGSYKIKNYYLENYDLQEIRGASILLSYVEDTLIKDIISKEFITECIIYCGGGNIFAVVPENCNEDFTIQLERKAKELLVSADIAYYLSPKTDLSIVFGKDYRIKMSETENLLNERKKLIINTDNSNNDIDYKIYVPESSKGANDEIDVTVVKKKICIDTICSSCGKRKAKFYGSKNDNTKGKVFCMSCLYKHTVGKEAKSTKYINMYNNYNSKIKADKNVRSLSDIKDNDHYIAIVYGDGNNMGGIIQNFTRITQMMEFSRDVKDIAARSVFESMGEHEINRFEVVGLGGDDIFVIVEGKKAIRFTISLIEKYNKKFEKYKNSGQVSTMSAGIAIAKYDTPVQVILEEAENQLSIAKDEVKKYPDNQGSISLRIMDAFESFEEEDTKIKNTMFPYLTENAVKIVEFAKENKRTINKTGLRNILDAFMDSESKLEANLFLDYYKAKNKTKDLTLPKLSKYSNDGGYYVDETGQYCFLWKDLINIIDFID